MSLAQRIPIAACLLGLAVLIFLSSPSAADQGADADNPPAWWFVCQNDEECVEVTMPCAIGAVNRKYQAVAEKYFEGEAYKALECTPPDAKAPVTIICDRYMPDVSCNSSSETCVSKHGKCTVLEHHKY